MCNSKVNQINNKIFFLTLIFLVISFSKFIYAQYEYRASEMFSMKVNGQPVFVEYYKTVPDEQGSAGVRWKLENVSISHFFFTGEVEVEVTCNASFTKYNLSPKSYGIESTREGNTITFKIDRPIKLNINMDNEDIVNEQLFIFADGLEDKPDLSSNDVKNILSYPGTNNSGKLEITSVIQNAINGLGNGGTLYFPPGQYLTKTIKLKSNMTLYLESGAMLIGTENYSDYRDDYAMVLIKDCQNTAIKGYGRINQRGEKMQNDYGGMCFSHNIKIVGSSNNVRLEDIITLDPPRLNVEVSGENSLLYNVRALATQAGENTDGINPWKSSHVVYDNCFIYGRDDNIAIKRYFDGFVARNCVLTTLEGAEKIGTETEGPQINNIVFENNDVLYSSHAASIWSRDGATIDNVWWRNIRVERIKPSPYGGQGMPFYFTVLPRDENANPGSVTNLHIQNVTCETRTLGIDGKSYIAGSDEDSKISNVEFTNLIIADSLVTNDNYSNYFQVGRNEWQIFVDNLNFGTAEFVIVEVSADAIDINEGQSSSFTITRKGDLSPSFTVEYWIRGTAKNGTDYTTISNSVNFSSGQESATVGINSSPDELTERIEQVYISLKSDAEQAFMLGPVFNAMINIRDVDYTQEIIISDPLMPGSEPPNRIEGESMNLNNYEIESNEDASEGNIIKISSDEKGEASFIFDRYSSNYDLNICYVAEEDGAPTYKLYVNHVQVDSWVATQTASTWEYKIHKAGKIFIAYGDEVKIEGTPNEGAAARIDYLDIINYEDDDPPAPDPMIFAEEPYASGTTHLTMIATKANDLSGVEYYFKNVTDTTHNSGWQDDILFIDTGLQEGMEYTYCVKARDKSAQNNETAYSAEFSATTLVSTVQDSIFLEKDGICVMEAENALVSENGDSSGWSSPFSGAMKWYEENAEDGYVGSGYMNTLNGVALNATWGKATQLAWPVKIENSGEYWLAIRCIAKNGQNNSAFQGVDDIQKGGILFTDESTTFIWQRGVSLGTLVNGVRMIQIRRREDGMIVDRVMIANSDSKLPANGSAEDGPEESSKGDPLGIEDNDAFSNVPEKFAIMAYPNPFNPSVTISYSIPQTVTVSLIIYDIMGRKVKTLTNQKQNTGNYSVVWNADNDNGNYVSTGIYFYNLNAGKFAETGKLLYIR